MNRIDHLKELYGLLDQLESVSGGMRLLCELRPRNPRRGVYFFFEPGEQRTDSGRGPRLTRIGTHGLGAGAKSTLQRRLRQHRGNTVGAGNHRGSIFRLLVGETLSARGDCPECLSWGKKSSMAAAVDELGASRDDLRAREEPIERAVSEYLGKMPFLLRPVDDDPGRDSLRGVIERNTIALVSNLGRDPLEPPSTAWLGRSSKRQRVTQSGLWNQGHVDEAYRPDFLRVFESLMTRGLHL